jgi:hypothetical protein
MPILWGFQALKVIESHLYTLFVTFFQCVSLKVSATHLKSLGFSGYHFISFKVTWFQCISLEPTSNHLNQLESSKSNGMIFFWFL